MADTQLYWGMFGHNYWLKKHIDLYELAKSKDCVKAKGVDTYNMMWFCLLCV